MSMLLSSCMALACMTNEFVCPIAGQRMCHCSSPRGPTRQASIPQAPCTSADLPHAGHHAAVLDLAACSARPGQVLSLSEDASARLWDVVEEICLAVWTLDALSLVRVVTADYTRWEGSYALEAMCFAGGHAGSMVMVA